MKTPPGSPPKTTTTGTKTKTKRSITGHAQRATRIRLMEVTITYEQDSATGVVSVQGPDYYAARDEATNLIPDGAVKLSIRVDRDA
ncbi:hypothetical protein ACNPON_17880 [Glutamicibacter sp. AGC13]